jgi:hypothetical protein
VCAPEFLAMHATLLRQWTQVRTCIYSKINAP